jgi:hypothetical protein
MLLGNSNLWLNLREIQINSVLLIGQLELFITKNRLYPVLFFKRYCFQLSPRKTHCKFDPRVLGHPVLEPLHIVVVIVAAASKIDRVFEERITFSPDGRILRAMKAFPLQDS